MYNDLKIITDLPDILILREDACISATMLMFWGLSLGMFMIPPFTPQGQDGFSVWLGACAGALTFGPMGVVGFLVAVWHLLCALRITTTFRAGSGQIELRRGGLIWSRTRIIDATHALAVVTSEVKTDDDGKPVEYHYPELQLSPYTSVSAIRLGQAEHHLCAKITNRINDVLQAARATAPPVP